MIDIPIMPPLYALEPGDRAIVAMPGSIDPAVVDFLGTLGLRPGVQVEIKEKHPFDGPLVLTVDGQDRTLGATVARQVFVSVDDARAPTDVSAATGSPRPGDDRVHGE